MLLTIEPITLGGEYIILRPPTIEDIDGLSKAAREERYGIILFLNFLMQLKCQHIYRKC
jgi:hypothetical protein